MPPRALLSRSRRALSRTTIVLALAVSLGLGSIVAIVDLGGRALESRQDETKLADVSTDLNSLAAMAWTAVPRWNGATAQARAAIADAEGRVATTLGDLRRHAPAPALQTISQPLRAYLVAVDAIVAYAARGFAIHPELADAYRQTAQATLLPVVAAIQRAREQYDARASQSSTQARFGSATVIVLLLAAFGFFFLRAVHARRLTERLMTENGRLLEASRQEALTDALTGLGNRRALMSQLTAELGLLVAGEQIVLALFDLDGFKHYNDTFGHPAGDALLARLGDQLAASVRGHAGAYRMGGDEFCVLARACDGHRAIVERAAQALCEEGDGFRVRASYGMALLPGEARIGSEALRLADDRMYQHKSSGRRSASRQSADVLIRVLSERSTEFQLRAGRIAALAARLATQLGLGPAEADWIRLAAELNDVGKSAIPDSILNEPGRLSAREWDLMRNHTLIGERIILGAPSLAHAAPLVRSSHERVDGRGYPDGLVGGDIPLGARIIAVCDAFDAMTSERSYRERMSIEQARAELLRCAGTQFDPSVVESFITVLDTPNVIPLTRAA